MSVRPERWVLTQEAFDAFLTRLDPDRDQAGKVYEQIRRKLLTFFRINGCWGNAEELADTTLDRVVRRHQEVEVLDLPAFIRGVGRRVASETHKSKVRQIGFEEVPEVVAKGEPFDDPVAQAASEKRLHCLEKCGRILSQSDRELIVEFYQFDGSQKIENKRRMAEARGITVGALRVRAFRVRERLEACMTRCLGTSSTS